MYYGTSVNELVLVIIGSSGTVNVLIHACMYICNLNVTNKLTSVWHSSIPNAELPVHGRQLLASESLSFSDDQPLWQSPSSPH